MQYTYNNVVIITLATISMAAELVHQVDFYWKVFHSSKQETER